MFQNAIASGVAIVIILIVAVAIHFIGLKELIFFVCGLVILSGVVPSSDKVFFGLSAALCLSYMYFEIVRFFPPMKSWTLILNFPTSAPTESG